MSGITNIRYTVDGMHFDAAVDWLHQLHIYGNLPVHVLSIELYNFDRKAWDIKVIYQDFSDQNIDGFGRPSVDFDFILEETKRWIKEMK